MERATYFGTNLFTISSEKIKFKIGGIMMRRAMTIFQLETKLYLRDFFSFFFTFAFPALLLILYGSIYGNEPSEFFGGKGTIDVSIPAYCAMIIGVTGLMAFPLTLSYYKENRIYKRFDATPVGKGFIIWIQIAVNILMTVLGFFVLLLVGKLIYDVTFEGNIFAISFTIMLSIATIFSIGFFFTAIARDSKMTNLLCYVSYFAMLFLSGATMPKEMFSDTLLTISGFLPLTYVVDLLQGTFTGESLVDYTMEIILLVGILLGCSLAGAVLYRKKNWV